MRWKWGVTANRYRVFFGEYDENVLNLGSGDGCVSPNTLKITELYNLEGWIFVCEGSSVELILKNINDSVAILIHGFNIKIKIIQ